MLPFVSNPETERNLYWLHYATDGLVKLNAYKGHWPEFMAKETLLPTPDLCTAFGKIAKDNQLQMFYLEEQNTKLAQARDLLLPRLMNGEIAV